MAQNLQLVVKVRLFFFFVLGGFMSFRVSHAKYMHKSDIFYLTLFIYFRGGFWQSHDLEHGASPARGG